MFEAKKDAFWGELIAACANATKAWNAADGSPVRVYASEQSPKSLTLRTERGTAGILLVLHESDAHLFVRQRSSLRGDTHYIAMVVTAGDELRARYDREDLAADSLARAVLEPWFTRLARERDA